MAASVGKYEMIFSLKGEDKATTVLKKVDGSFKKTANQAKKAGASFQGTGGATTDLTGSIMGFLPGGAAMSAAMQGMSASSGLATLGISALTAGIMAAVGALFMMRGRAEEAAALTFRLSRLGDGFAETTIKIRKLKRESGGVFSTKQLVDFLTVQKEMNVDLGITAQNLRMLDLRFTALGLDVGTGLRQMTEAIKTGRQMYLQKLGLVDNLTEAWKKEAKSIGHVLSQEEKMVVTIREVKKGMANIQVGGSGGPITAFERIAATFEEFGVALGELFDPLFEALAPFLEGLQGIFESLVPVASLVMRPFQAGFQLIGEVLRGIVDVLGSFIIPLVKTLDRLLGDRIAVTTEAIRDGFVIIAGWAEGLALSIADWLDSITRVHEEYRDFLVTVGYYTQTELDNLRALEKALELGRARTAEFERGRGVIRDSASLQKQINDLGAKNLSINEKIETVLRRSEKWRLEQKKAAVGLTGEELKRLDALAVILRVEGATSKIKAQMAVNAKNILAIELKRAELQARVREGGPMVGLAFAGEIAAMNTALFLAQDNQKILAAEMQAAGKAAAKFAPAEKATKARGGPKKLTEEDAARAKEITNELREIELGLIGEKNKLTRASAEMERGVLRASLAALQGDQKLADHQKKVAFQKWDNALTQIRGLEAVQAATKKAFGEETVLSIKLARTTDEAQKIEIQHKKDLIKVQLAEMAGKELLADRLRTEADARRAVSVAALDQARAMDAAREKTASLSQSIGVLQGMSGQFADNEAAALGTALGGLGGVAHNLEQNQIGVTQAISQSGPVVAQAADAFGASQRQMAGIMAAFEFASGWAALGALNPISAAAHFLAAGLFGAVASGAGGVSDEGGAASGKLGALAREDRGAEKAGDRTVVINISGVVTDAQGVGKQVKLALGSLEGTGA